VPTVVEAGISNYEATVWWGLVAAAGTPADIVEKIDSAAEQSLAEPATREKLSEIGVVVDAMSPEPFGRFLRAETARWSSVIRDANIKPD
jgi:tripartite-type tricarboxylate transporter receptor subunit TctC